MSDTAEDLLKKIKSNQPEELNTDNDFLGTIPKGNMIKGFLESLLKHPAVKDKSDIQMIALYGEWGSGKTSLMKYVQSQLPEESFKTVFFESWLLENDNDLALSLLESILSEHKAVEIRESMVDAFLAVSKGVLSGLSINTPVLKFDFDKLQKEIGVYLKDHSFKERIDSFKDEYRSLEDNILSKDQRLIVFVDDLDRCEPQNVLNLLSAIKLFFTFGNRTIFVCGLDEKAVDEAVKVKYKDVVKSGEYMEKIFDISFDMPKPNINKMIAYYFEDMPDTVKGVQEFFEAMHFTNPRHIKKVLNKYLLFRYYKIPLPEHKDPIDKDGLIPNQNIAFLRYLTLFIIILYKFNTVKSNEFSVIRDYDEKLNYWDSEWTGKNFTIAGLQNLNFNKKGKYSSLKEIYSCPVIFTVPKNSDKQEELPYSEEGFRIKLVSLFAPYIQAIHFINDKKYCNQFVQKSKDENEIGYAGYFCNYIMYNMEKLFKNCQKEEWSDYPLWNIFDMAERYL